MNEQDIKAKVRNYILHEFLPGEDPSALTDTTELISTGILDSIAVLNLVVFLEKEFGVQFEAHETGMDYLNTVADIARLVHSKKS